MQQWSVSDVRLSIAVVSTVPASGPAVVVPNESVAAASDVVLHVTGLQRKLAHAGLVGLMGALTDIGAQIATGAVNITRVVIVGFVMTGLARGLGAILAACAFDEKTP